MSKTYRVDFEFEFDDRVVYSVTRTTPVMGKTLELQITAGNAKTFDVAIKAVQLDILADREKAA